MKIFKWITPFVILFALLGLLGMELSSPSDRALPSVLTGEPLPLFKLVNLFSPKKHFSPEDMAGHVSLLHVWASWCSACREESAMLMKIHTTYRIPVYAISYKDEPQQIKKWLQQHGNPYRLIGLDSTGDTAIDLGVYGTPETFIISPEGKIVYRHIGQIDQNTWDQVLYPLIKKYQVSTR